MEYMGLVRRRENDQTYFYWYENGKKVYLGTLKDRTVIEKVRYIGSNMDKLSEEEKKEFMTWLNELYNAVSSILGKNSNTSVPNLGNIELKEINEKLDKVLEILNETKKRKKTTYDLDILYDKMKDSLGFVRIDNLRKELGMTFEEFMQSFGDYIEKHYELIPGGEEGFIRNGVKYGIIRRKS